MKEIIDYRLTIIVDMPDEENDPDGILEWEYKTIAGQSYGPGGWQPFGSPFYHPKENRIYQAMVKYEGVNYDPLPNDHGER